MDTFNSADMDLEADLFSSDNEQEVLNDRDMSSISSSQFASTFHSEFDAQSLGRTTSSVRSGGTPSEVSTLTPSASGSQITWYNRSSQRRSWIWRHGTPVSINGKAFWRCGLCRNNPKQYSCGSTRHPIEHLRTQHRFTERGILEPDSQNSIIRQAFGNSIPRIQFNKDTFKQLLIQWVVLCHISFRQVEEPSFRLLLSYLSATSASYTSIPQSLPRSGSTVRAWTMQLFLQQKQALIILLESPCTIHFTFDLWTSGNHLALLGLVAHWINQEGKCCRALLGLRRMYEAHTGENQSQILFTVLQEYSLVHKIGYFTLDNATNNDSALLHLSQQLKDMGIKFDPIESRLRCVGHVINLVVKAFLYGQEFVSTNDVANDEEDLDLYAQWRKRGPYGRLRNIITYICWTPQRREEFAKITQEAQPEETAFQPIAANLTRWNSDFKALKRALQLRNGFEVFIARHMRDGLQNDQLDVDDWAELQDIVNILEPFHRYTLELEGHRGNGALYDLLPTMDYLLEHLETAKSHHTAANSTTHLISSILLAWQKLDKYYALTDSNTAIYAAVALHPSMKFEYFEINWAEHPAWIESARNKVTLLWETWYVNLFNYYTIQLC